MKPIRIILLCFFVFSAFAAPAKENKDLMKANYYYAHFAYFDAIPYYEKVAEQLNEPAIYAQLADCYSVTNSLQKAAGAYAKAVALKGCSSTVVLHYAQLLMQQAQYDEAAKWLKEYQEKEKNDKRAANMIAGCGSAKALLAAIPEGTTSLLGFNSDGSEFAPTLWNGYLVFASDTVIDLKKKTDNWTGRAYYNIYSIACDNRGHCSGDLNKLTDTKKMNTRFHDGPCTFTADGKQMYYTRSRCKDNFLSKGSISNKDSIVLLEIMIASDYDSASRKFRTITPFEFNSKEYSVAHPTVSPNGKLLVFSSNKPRGLGGSDLYLCKNVRGKWAKPQNIGNVLNTEGEEVFPYWADNTTLFFSSDGHEGLGGLDIYRTIWNESTGTFSKPENIGTPINSSYDDISLALFADGRSTYFSSNRPAEKGSDNIYFYKREKIFLQVNVTDAATKQPLSGVSISLSQVKATHDTAAEINGMFFTRLYPESQYAITVSKDGYGPQELSVTATSTKDIDTIVRNVGLLRPPPPVVKQPDTLARVPFISFTKTVGVPELNKVYEIGHFYFAYNSAALTDTAKIVLDSLAGFLATQPTMRIQVRAHTDCRGGDAYNMKLSDARAHSVVTYLKQKGIPESKLSYIGLGMREPKVPCPICEKCTEQQYYLNRVLEFKVLEL